MAEMRHVEKTGTMQSPPANTPQEDDTGKSRLDREIEEILSKDDNIRHLPPPPKRPVHPPPSKTAAPRFDSFLTPRARQLLSAPIVVALGLAIGALLVSGFSPFLANILCLAAVVAIIFPMTQRFRRPASPPETRMWRGQVMDVQSSRPNSPLDSVREWWRSRNS